MIRRIAIVVVAAVTLWCVALLVLDATLADRQAETTAARLGESLQATATIGHADLALVRGGLDLHALALHRDDLIGRLAIDVANIHCDLPPLGLALVDGECRMLEVGGVRLSVSSAALFHLKPPKRAPVRARRVVIDDATLVFSPSAIAPSLGAITIAIEHAEAGATVFRTPLSWLFALDELRARIDLPAGISLHLGYHDGKFSAASSIFGSTPVELPVTLPAANTAHDAHEEIDLLVATGKDLAERLVAKRAQDWLESKLSIH